jgi:hypothetical protein
MDAALAVIFPVAAIGGVVAWIAAIPAPWERGRWRYLGAVVLLTIAGVLTGFSYGIFFLVLAVLCLVSAAVSAARARRSPASNGS